MGTARRIENQDDLDKSDLKPGDKIQVTFKPMATIQRINLTISACFIFPTLDGIQIRLSDHSLINEIGWDQIARIIF